MKVEKVLIRQIPDDNAVQFGLHKYGRSKMPKSFDIFQVGETSFGSGVFVTGLDEKGLDLLLIRDVEERKQVAEEREQLRKQLEQYTGKDLSARSSFWREFMISIDPDNKQVLNRFNPLDVIKYHALTANGYVAPSEREAAHPRYKSAKYYFLIEDVVNDEEVSTVKKRDKARSELLKLDDDKDKLVLIGQYLEGGKYKESMKPSTLYKNLSDYINDVSAPEHVDDFVKAVKLPTEDLKYKVTVDTAIRKKIIKFKEGYYYFGATNLGKNAIDVFKNLKLPEFSSECLAIQDLINEK